MATMVFTYWSNAQLSSTIWSIPGVVMQKTGTNSIMWDPTHTQITSAKLHGIVSAQLGNTGQIYFNGNLTHFCDARLNNASIDTIVDVTGYLHQGVNSVMIELTPSWAAGTITYTAELTIEYVGDPPNITTPTGAMDWLKIAVYFGIGIGTILAVAVLIRAIRR
jgi:hypothetical protein